MFASKVKSSEKLEKNFNQITYLIVKPIFDRDGLKLI